MNRSNILAAALCAALAVGAAVEWRPSALEIASWNVTMPPAARGDAVFSPVGFGMTVAMLGEGIGGSARADMAESLGLISDFSVAFANVFKSYDGANVSNRVAISLASSLWTTRRRALSAEYILSLQKNFGAEAGYLSAVLPVNIWTEAKTDGRIANVLPEMPHKVDTLVVNAVAFEGAWKKPFERSKGKPTDFTLLDGRKVKVPIMRTTCPIVRVARERYVAAMADFAAKGMKFIVVLPAAGVGFAELREKDFAGGGIDELKALLRERMGNGVTYARTEFALPRFTIRSDWRIDAALRKAKVPQRGFDRMGEGVFNVNDVRQSAYISVSGKGYSLTPGMEPEVPEKPSRKGRSELAKAADKEEDADLDGKPGIPFVCNRPFLFFVWDMTTDTLILAGQFTGEGQTTKDTKGDSKP